MRIPGTDRLTKARLAFDHDLTLADVFHRVADSDPDRRLVDELDGPTYTAGEAAAAVERWAGGIATGIAPGDVVVVATPNGYDQVLLCAAVSRAGGVPAPVNEALYQRILEIERDF